MNQISIAIDLDKPLEGVTKLMNLATVLSNLVEVTEKKQTKPQTPKEEPKPEPKPVAVQGEISRDEYIELLQVRAREVARKAESAEIITDLLHKYGSTNLSALSSEDLPKFDEDLKQLEKAS